MEGGGVDVGWNGGLLDGLRAFEIEARRLRFIGGCHGLFGRNADGQIMEYSLFSNVDGQDFG